MAHRSAALGALMLACIAAPALAEPPTYIPLPGGEGLPFSAAVRVGDTLYLAGQVARERGTIAEETKQVLDSIKAVVEANGSSMDRVVKCTVFLADIDEWAAMNEVYVTYFPNKPARSALEVSELVGGARVEIECIAIVGD